MRGHKKAPVALVKLRGNPGRRPLNENEPKPTPGIPDPPNWLTEEEAETFRVFCDLVDSMGILSLADGPALANLVDCYHELLTAKKRIELEGEIYTVETANGSMMMRPHPAVNIRQTARANLRQMLETFGLTPSSRARFSVGEKMEDEVAEFMKRGRKAKNGR